MGASDFFQRMMPHAQRVSDATGIDPRLVLAQAALETGYGKHAPDNNFFGIKSHGRSGGNNLQTQEFENGRMVTKSQSFRGYSDPGQSFDDYGNFLQRNPRYKPVLQAGTLAEQIEAMGRSGYATDPNYASKLSQIAGMVDGNFQPSSKGIADGAMRAIGKDPIRQTSTAIGGQGADTMQQSTGLLGQLARPEDKVGGLLGMMFKNMTPDRADQIRAGLAGLHGNENPGIYYSATQRMGDRKAQRSEDTLLQRQQAEKQAAEAKAAQQREVAAQWATQNGNPQLAEAIMGGMVAPGKVYELATKGSSTEYGLTPQYVTRPDGTLGMIQLSKGGTAKEVEIPEGMALQRGLEKVDLGTHYQWYNNLTGTPIGVPIPKNNRDAARETAAGTSEGKTEAERTAAAPTVIAEAQTFETLIDDVISDPALDSVIGNVQGRLPAGIPGITGGQAGSDVQVKVDQIGGKAFLQAFESLKGGGQITEREGIAAQAAIARMNQSQSGPAFREALKDLKAIATNARLRAQGQDVPDYVGSADAPPKDPIRKKFNPATGKIE